VKMPTSSEEDEPVAPVPRSGRRAKKSRSTGSASTDQPELAGNTSTSKLYQTRRGTRATPATPAVPVGYLRLDRLAVHDNQYVCNIFPPFGACLVIGIQRAGRRRSPTATGSGRGRMDRVPSESRDDSHPSRRMRSTVYRTVTAVWSVGLRTGTGGPS
jgi:hypothetical protein